MSSTGAGKSPSSSASSHIRLTTLLDLRSESSERARWARVWRGGFLGLGEKHVAVPYDAVRMTTKDSNKWYLVMNSTKDALKNAPGYKFDRTAMTWMPENATTGSGTPSRPVTPTAPVAK